MHTITRQLLIELVSVPGNGVSLFMPLHVGAESRQDRIRLKNLLSEAQQLAHGRGELTEDWLAPLARQLDNDSWWEQGGRGLAAFLAPDYFRELRVAFPLSEQLVYGEGFAVKQVVPGLLAATQFYICALSENRLRLLRASADSVEELGLDGLPGSLNEFMMLDDREEQQQLHTISAPQSGRSAAMFHGSNQSWNDEEKRQLPLFINLLANGVSQRLQEDGAPLVLAGVEELTAAFQRECDYRGLLEPVLAGNVDELPARQLQLRAWEIVQRELQQQQQQALARIAELLGTAQVSAAETEVVQACAEGRVATLLAVDEPIWGRVDAAGRVQLADLPDAGARDLSEYAVAAALRTAAAVYCLPRNQMPQQARLAAELRY